MDQIRSNHFETVETRTFVGIYMEITSFQGLCTVDVATIHSILGVDSPFFSTLVLFKNHRCLFGVLMVFWKDPDSWDQNGWKCPLEATVGSPGCHACRMGLGLLHDSQPVGDLCAGLTEISRPDRNPKTGDNRWLERQQHDPQFGGTPKNGAGGGILVFLERNHASFRICEKRHLESK